ncbi:MAG TPA: thiol:disulfide interchange protein DsbA/DsbL [Tahibacter sp.]|uniref:thiol:disulfide interchange protein DsbA/DsbL n=1 Tax=Tahibacter sp. TaxID=2056211 RepID=UPI002B5835DB|nr:thiol:disulfide interchange protein DsbA/DsbL [Tahibacter sp.]HSX58588.1 thiol:disulfide interchange protein DsbA/DsbL [Tahibacter sp.]
MLKRLMFLFAGLLAVSACGAQDDKAAAPKTDWKEGQHYIVLAKPTPPASGKVEVTEVFSYACPHCAHFQPFADQLKAKLPAGVTFNYMPVVFNPSWEPLARAFYAAQSLGVLDKTHQALFDALHRDHKPLRSIEDLAGFYAGFGVDPKNFVSTAQSFVVEGNLSQGRERAMAYQIESTPTLVINGKYRLDAASAGGQGQAVELALFLVNKELAAKKK